MPGRPPLSTALSLSSAPACLARSSHQVRYPQHPAPKEARANQRQQEEGAMQVASRPEATGGFQFFTDRFGVDARVCDALLTLALARGGDYADLFFEYT